MWRLRARLFSILLMCLAPSASATPTELLPMVGPDGRYGYVDLTGRWVVAPRWADAGVFEAGRAEVTDGLGAYHTVYPDGRVAPLPGSCGSEGIWVAGEDRRGALRLVDADGRVLVGLPWLGEVRCFSQGLALARRPGDTEWGFIDRTGEWVLQADYDEAMGFHGDVAMVRHGLTWTAIDREGRVVSEDRWSEVWPPSEGLAVVRKFGSEKLWGAVDGTGKAVISARYDSVNTFKHGRALVSKDGEYWLLDARGRKRAGPYPNAWSQSEELWCVPSAEGVGCVDLDGKEKVPFVWDDFGRASHGFVALRKGEEWRILDSRTGKVLLSGPDALWFRATPSAVFTHEGPRRVWRDRTGRILIQGNPTADAALYKDAILAFEKGEAARARELFTGLAERGHADAMWFLSVLPEEPEADGRTAKAWFERAIAAESGKALRSMALERFPTDAAEPATEEAMTLLKRAAAAGDGDALGEWGVILLNGAFRSPVDTPAAIDALSRAVTAGSVVGQHTLGWVLLHGDADQTKDVDRAVTLITQAAEGGFWPSQALLGELYQRGIGVSKDVEAALRWYDAAAAQGHEEAKKRAAAIRATLSPPAAP